MTKAKARQRAKAKATQNAGKRKANVDQPSQARFGQFDPGSGSIKGLNTDVNARHVARGQRGAGRSR
jgi:hypothetical protein